MAAKWWLTPNLACMWEHSNQRSRNAEINGLFPQSCVLGHSWTVMPWHHNRGHCWRYITMTFSVFLCVPSQQAPKRGRRVTMLLCAPWRMASWHWCGPGKFSGWIPVPKALEPSKSRDGILWGSCLIGLQNTERETALRWVCLVR